MKILIAQPYHENETSQLERELKLNNVDIVLFPEGYLQNQSSVLKAVNLAKVHKTMIVTGYKDDKNKNRAIIIGPNGKKLLDRAKFHHPYVIDFEGEKIAYLLCMELLEGLERLKDYSNIDLIFHPIGVGMFSKEQFNLWIETARTIAKTFHTKIIGTSHADGSYRNCGVSIPISYYINEEGNNEMITQNKTETCVINV